MPCSAFCPISLQKIAIFLTVMLVSEEDLLYSYQGDTNNQLLFLFYVTDKCFTGNNITWDILFCA